jgi:hypothetical protein
LTSVYEFFYSIKRCGCRGYGGEWIDQNALLSNRIALCQ